MARPSVLGELFEFLRYNKKWWLIPIIIVLLLVALLVWVTATGMSFAIYTLA